MVTTAAAGRQRGGGDQGGDRRDRSPRRPQRIDVRVRAWFGIAPSPFAQIKAVLEVDPEVLSLREPDPEPLPGESLPYHRARWETLRNWLDLYDVHPDVARQALADALDTFD